MLQQPPISEKKLQANRANAKRSTGPRTPAGKAAVRGNAFKHGVRSATASLLPGETPVEFNDVLLNLKKMTQASTPQEEITWLWWKLRRVAHLESECLCSGRSDPGADAVAKLQLVRRYEGSLSRQLSARIRQAAKLDVPQI